MSIFGSLLDNRGRLAFATPNDGATPTFLASCLFGNLEIACREDVVGGYAQR